MSLQFTLRNSDQSLLLCIDPGDLPHGSPWRVLRDALTTTVEVGSTREVRIPFATVDPNQLKVRFGSFHLAPRSTPDILLRQPTPTPQNLPSFGNAATALD